MQDWVFRLGSAPKKQTLVKVAQSQKVFFLKIRFQIRIRNLPLLRKARMRLNMRCPGITMANKRFSVSPEDIEVDSKVETIWFPSAVPKH